jgi:hypothetical protein
MAWGRDVLTKEIRHVSEVANGNKCGCVCLECKEELVSHQGEKMAWHFKHKVLSNCQGMSVLHYVAQEVLKEAAQEGETLFLSGSQGSITLQDSNGISYTESWVLDACEPEMTSADLEVRLEAGLQSDALVTFTDGRRVAVEIHVTNKKTDLEQQKYSQEGLSCLEIDLSDLPWDSNVEDIKVAVLAESHRHWVHNEQIEELKAKAREALLLRIKDAEDFYKSRFLRLVKRITEDSELSALDGIDLGISSDKAIPDYGPLIAAPSVVGVVGDWESTGGTYKTKVHCITPKIRGLASYKPKPPALIDLVIIPEEKPAKLFVTKGSPTLCIQLNRHEKGQPEDISFRAFWMEIDRWKDRLNSLAQGEIDRINHEDNEVKEREKDFCDLFQKLGDHMKMEALIADLDLEEPDFISNAPCKPWNSSWAIWKTAVWRYCVLEAKDGLVRLSKVARDAWLTDLLDLDDALKAERQKVLWFWFKDMAELGIFEHRGRQQFQIVNYHLLKELKPWEKIQ